jgi:hypothetical protein
MHAGYAKQKKYMIGLKRNSGDKRIDVQACEP